GLRLPDGTKLLKDEGRRVLVELPVVALAHIEIEPSERERAMAESMGLIGQLHQVCITIQAEGVRLLAGRDRLAGARAAGLTSVLAWVITDSDETTHRLVETDENFVRRHDPAERDAYLAERERLLAARGFRRPGPRPARAAEPGRSNSKFVT